MPLNLRVNDGDFTPYIKYNAKAGRWYIKGDDGVEVEVVNPRLVFDMSNIKTGWIDYPEGAGPEKVWHPTATTRAPQPNPRFKEGFEVLVFGPDAMASGGKVGLREFSSVAVNCKHAVIDLYSEYEALEKANPGKLPFVHCVGVEPISGKYGTNYEPKFKIIGWVERAKVPEFDANRPTEAPASNGDWQAPASGSPAKGADPLDDEIPFEMSWK
jgi:hypothetical protein